MGEYAAWARVFALILFLATIAATPSLAVSQNNNYSNIKIKLVYELGSKPLTLEEVVNLLGLYNDTVTQNIVGARYFRACFAFASPNIRISESSVIPKVNVKCWGSFCPSLISEADLRNFFVNVREALLCAGDARLAITIQNGLAELTLRLKDLCIHKLR